MGSTVDEDRARAERWDAVNAALQVALRYPLNDHTSEDYDPAEVARTLETLASQARARAAMFRGSGIPSRAQARVLREQWAAERAAIEQARADDTAVDRLAAAMAAAARPGLR